MANDQDAATEQPQSDNSGEQKHDQTVSTFDRKARQRTFMAMAIGMSWQLALVVIVPIFGGYLLDVHYHKAPWLTLAGLVVAAIGVFGVLSRVVIEAEKAMRDDTTPKERP